ncbi:MAG: hypothetical protein GF372_07660 [Candidatus Marinimicrobia bacterium]|nr:hypothetical protein [Candidatus Neomarinimicrobiota bacterium]
MAYIYDKDVNRRQFIKKMATAFGALSVVTLTPGSLKAGQPIRLALLADTHIPADVKNSYRGFYPYENLQKIAPRVAEANTDGVIIDGDLARLEGLTGDYTNLKSLIQPITEVSPVYLGLGNHDNRQNFYEVFDAHEGNLQEVEGKHVVILESAEVRFIVLDSLLYVNKVAGLLGKNQRTWLEHHLENSDEKPIVLFVHHTLGDGDGDLLDVDRLFDLMQPYSKVKSIVYGHSHSYNVTRRQGVQLINLPAVGYNFSDTEPVGWVEAEFDKEGVSLKLHAVDGNTADDGQVTRVEWL